MNRIQNEQWVNALPNEAIKIADEINIEIAKIIAERIKAIGELSPADVKRLTNSLQYLGSDFGKITKLIAKYSKQGQMAVVDALKKAADGNDEFAEVFYSAKGIAANTWRKDPYLHKLVEAMARQTAAEFTNLSQTLAYKIDDRTLPLRQMYTRAIDKAIYEVQSGTVDYHTAMRKTVKQLSDNMRVLKWKSGYQRRIDSHIRQNLIDGIKQLQQEMLDYHGQRFGSDGVELSAHAISAPDHVAVQGRQFSNEEFYNMQNGMDFEDVRGNEYQAFKREIGNWNCRHVTFPIIIGISQPVYTDEQLEQMAQNSRKQYDNTQKMRALETKLRYLKNQRLALSASGDDLEARRVQRQINQKQKEYREFCQKHGLTPQPERARVPDYKKVSTKVLTTNKSSGNIEMYRKGYTHRRISDNNTSIIDKPTYHKITNPIIKQGADIRIAEGKWLERLKLRNASALTIGDVIFLKKDATVSDVLEEARHFMQNKTGLNSQFNSTQREIMNEIEAKEYLLSMTEKYHIPEIEVELTKEQLENYKKQMKELQERGEWDD